MTQSEISKKGESWKLNGVIILALEVGENREKTGYLKKIGHRYSNKK